LMGRDRPRDDPTDDERGAPKPSVPGQFDFGRTGRGHMTSATYWRPKEAICGASSCSGTLVCCDQPMVTSTPRVKPVVLTPRGHFWISYPKGGGEFCGQVVCLNVVGNVAGLIGHSSASRSQDRPPGSCSATT
jgi:hypothetical protein